MSLELDCFPGPTVGAFGRYCTPFIGATTFDYAHYLLRFPSEPEILRIFERRRFTRIFCISCLLA